MYNSRVGLHQDDSDITIINPSIMHEQNDEYVDNTYVPIITRLKQANNSSENRQITTSQTNNNDNNNQKCENDDGKHEYVFVDHNPLENAKHLEQVLTFYIRDLKQESSTQLDCDKQLVTRLMDLIRPAYLKDQPKMIQLDKIMEDIGLLHDKRHIEQKEKIEQLRTEICRLNKMLFTASNDHSIYNDNTKSYSMFSTMHQGHSIHDYDQWTEIEDDAKKLHELVESQKNQINEIVSLISQSASAPASLDTTNLATNKSEDATTDKQLTPTSNNNMISSLLEKIQRITGQQTQQGPVTTTPPADTKLINHSPGVSPTQSLATLTLETLTPTIDNQNEPTEERHDKPVDNQEQPRVPVDNQQQPRIQIDNQQQPRVPIDNQQQPRAPVDNQQQPRVPVDNQQQPRVPVDNRQQPRVPIDNREQPHAPIDIPIVPAPPIESKKCPVCNYEFAPTSDDVEMYDHIEKCLFPTGIYTEPKDYECPNCNRKFPGIDERAYLEHLSDCYNRDV